MPMVTLKSVDIGPTRQGIQIVYLCDFASGKSMQLLCILPFGMLCLSAISMMFVKIMLVVCILVGMVV